MSKQLIGINVLEAAQGRIEQVFKYFPKIYLSFSGGKDSSVTLHLAAAEARKTGKKFGVLIVDLEAQYKYTIEHIEEMLDEYADCIVPYWVAVPISLRNAVSVFEPKWTCWDQSKKDLWVRDPNPKSITDASIWDFHRDDMEFEEFVPLFGDWYSQGQPCACIVGIRTDESLNRYRTIANKKKKTFNKYQWTTRIWDTTVYNCYPIYDWATKDIWTYNNRSGCSYNKLYDVMNMAGLTIHQQRICQPYGDDQRRGLWLYQVIEPETWAKVVARVAGVNSGAEFVQWRGNASGNFTVSKPDEHSWQSFSSLLLETMPEHMSEHYKNKIHVFLRWYESRGYPDGIPDFIDTKDENAKSKPSWRRIAKMLLRNDYWAKGLSFSQTKSGYFYNRYLERVKKQRNENGKKTICKYTGAPR